MKLALHSANPRLGNVEANVATVTAAVRAAGKKGVDLVVFPEMFLSGYAIGDDAQRLAFAAHHDARLSPLIAACRETQTNVIAGAPMSPRRGVTQNCALLVRGDGTVSWYAKRCLPTFTTFSEGLFFEAGKTSPVWDLPLRGRPEKDGSTKDGGAGSTVSVGIGICYDLYFPEHQKAQVLAGADVLVNISASPAVSRRFFESLLQGRAIENACFTAYSNCVGAQDNLVFWGGAQAIGPRGQLLAGLEPYVEGAAVVELDLGDLVAAREFRPTIRDSDEKDLHLVGHSIKALDPRTTAATTKGKASAAKGRKMTTKAKKPAKAKKTKQAR